MSVQLFLRKSTLKPVPLFATSDAEYFYDFSSAAKTLRIFRGKKVIHKQKAITGDAFFCSVNGKTFTINQLQLPRKRSDLIAWAIGCPAKFRANCLEDFFSMHSNNIAPKNRKTTDSRIYLSDKTYYYFSLCKPQSNDSESVARKILGLNKDSTPEQARIAVYISEDITAQSIRKFFSSYLEKNSFNFPISYFTTICLRLGLSKNDINRIVKNKESHFVQEDIVQLNKTAHNAQVDV
jgi:hypothetical protein